MNFYIIKHNNIIIKIKIIILLSYDYIKKNLDPIEDLNEIYTHCFDKLENRLL